MYYHGKKKTHLFSVLNDSMFSTVEQSLDWQSSKIQPNITRYTFFFNYPYKLAKIIIQIIFFLYISLWNYYFLLLYLKTYVFQDRWYEL